MTVKPSPGIKNVCLSFAKNASQVLAFLPMASDIVSLLESLNSRLLMTEIPLYRWPVSQWLLSSLTHSHRLESAWHACCCLAPDHNCSQTARGPAQMPSRWMDRQCPSTASHLYTRLQVQCTCSPPTVQSMWVDHYVCWDRLRVVHRSFLLSDTQSPSWTWRAM